MKTNNAWDVDRTIVRFPGPAVEIVDERFRSLVVGHEVVERLWSGGRWLEGPVWFGDGRYLLFSDIPNDRMMCWSEATGEVTVFRQPSNNSNGNTRDRQGRLVTCEHLTRRVTRTEYDGSVTVLAEEYEGRRLNAPNDVVVAPDHAVWFTDPGYGILSDYEGGRAEAQLPTAVYRVDPGGAPEPLGPPPWARAPPRPRGAGGRGRGSGGGPPARTPRGPASPRPRPPPAPPPCPSRRTVPASTSSTPARPGASTSTTSSTAAPG